MSSVGLAGIALRRGGQPVIEHVTLAVEAGEQVVLTGRRGAGKSSLLAVAAGTLRPDAGEVVLGGRDITALQSGSLPYLRRNIGYLTAEPPFLDHETVLENVMLAPAARGLSPARAREQASATLTELGLAACAHKVVRLLSAAERRLCALARALCGPPPVLVLDDPGAGLHPHDRALAAQGIENARAAGSAVLCASNDGDLIAHLAARGARVLCLEGGRITGGSPGIRLVEVVEDTEVSPALVAVPSRASVREAG
jgi:ABC-type ATPase involved in cell division